ncbi:MAG: SurA N-terminal domain-containing protein [Rhizobiaceae bacterium]
MNWVVKRYVGWAIALAVSLTAISAVAVVPTPSHASEIKYIVNGVPVTTYDVQRRTAFLKLQRRKGNLAAIAADEMIDQTLRAAEIKRLNIKVTDNQVAASYKRFAEGNKMSTKQLDGILTQSGVTPSHFKQYIRSQMGWGQALGARGRGGGAGGRMTEQEMVRKMMEKGGGKPSATEYMLQQVIFVVPPKERSSTLGKRKRDAEAMRARFNGCNATREFAKGLIDVTVKDLPRILEPALPPEWAESIKATKTGGATPVRETEKGIEFIGICRAREVSDDRVAQMLFQKEGESDGNADEMSKKYTAELRAKAKIVNN